MSSAGAHGWNIDNAVGFRRLLLVRPVRVGNVVVGWGLAGARCWVLRDRSFGSFGVGDRFLGLVLVVVWPRCGFRPYFENYTVDASILDPC